MYIYICADVHIQMPDWPATFMQCMPGQHVVMSSCRHVISYYIVPYRIVSYRIASHRIVLHRIVSCWTRMLSSRHVISYRIIPYSIISYRIVPGLGSEPCRDVLVCVLRATLW